MQQSSNASLPLALSEGDQYTGVFTLSTLLVILAIAISAILLFNTITMMVTVQIAIIGTMKALGGTRGRIMLGYLLRPGCLSYQPRSSRLACLQALSSYCWLLSLQYGMGREFK